MKEQIEKVEKVLGTKAVHPTRNGDGSISVLVSLEKLQDHVPGVQEWMSRIAHKTLQKGAMDTAVARMEAAVAKVLFQAGVSAVVDVDPEHGGCAVRLPRWTDIDRSRADDVFRLMGPCSRHETSEFEHYGLSIGQVADSIPSVRDYLIKAKDGEEVITVVVSEVVKLVEASLENRGLDTVLVSCDLWFEDGEYCGGVVLRSPL